MRLQQRKETRRTALSSDDAAGDLGEGKHCVRAGDDDVTVESDLDAASIGRAVDGSDDRLGGHATG